jgi:TfoX/Sxy family transcriptional regulator of competence genes
MAYNEKIADKIREALDGTKNLVEKKMFGGIAFMINDKMCIGVNNNDLIIRCNPEDTEELLKKPGAKPFDLSGKPSMKGWLLVGEKGSKKDLEWWLALCIESSSQAKASKSKKKV